MLDLIREATLNNTAFSPILPGLQIAWDSTSMGALKECPRKYFLSIVLGWIPREGSVHLIFGQYYHTALEAYDHAKSRGLDHRQALLVAVKVAMVVSWDKKAGRPWTSDSTYKNRLTLVRSVVWYLDQFGENDALKTVILANGKPAVELSFRFHMDYKSYTTGENFLLCGHIDRLVTYDNRTLVLDRKTTQHNIDDRYWKQFKPNNQMSTYDYAGSVFFHTPTSGIIIDAAQLLVSGTRFKRNLIERSDDEREEWYTDLGFQLKMAEEYAKLSYWPMNDKSCGNYGGCPFLDICGKSPKVRQQWLEGLFHRRVWDPLQVRGDI